MFCPFDDFQLDVLREAVEIFGIAADADHDFWIVLWIFVGFAERFGIENRDLNLQSATMEIGHDEGFRALAVFWRCEHVATYSHVEDRRAEIFGLVGSRDGVDERGGAARIRALDCSEGIAQRGARVAAVR